MSGVSRFTPEEKTEIVVLCLRNPDKISEICREKGVAPVTYNKWKRKFMDGGMEAMNRSGVKLGEDYRNNNRMLKEVIGHLYVEMQMLKKKMELER